MDLYIEPLILLGKSTAEFGIERVVSKEPAESMPTNIGVGPTPENHARSCGVFWDTKLTWASPAFSNLHFDVGCNHGRRIDPNPVATMLIRPGNLAEDPRKPNLVEFNFRRLVS